MLSRRDVLRLGAMGLAAGIPVVSSAQSSSLPIVSEVDPVGFRTGFPSIDACIPKGIGKGEIMVIMGRSGVGLTTICDSIAERNHCRKRFHHDEIVRGPNARNYDVVHLHENATMAGYNIPLNPYEEGRLVDRALNVKLDSDVSYILALPVKRTDCEWGEYFENEWSYRLIRRADYLLHVVADTHSDHTPMRRTSTPYVSLMKARWGNVSRKPCRVNLGGMGRLAEEVTKQEDLDRLEICDRQSKYFLF